MGLDMYLRKKHYVKNWDFMEKEEKHEVTVKRNNKVRQDIIPERISEVTETVMTWRKANAIHHWFVENVQDGNDDCGEYYVERSQLEELRNIIQKVLTESLLVEGHVQNGYHLVNGKKVPVMEEGKYIKDPSTAKKLLPTQPGFFFGATNYDQWYYSDLKETLEMLNK